jgi:putative ABC transport system substrate-binding protein
MGAAAGVRMARALRALVGCVLLVSCTAATAWSQAAGRTVRIGVLSPGSPGGTVPVLVEALRDSGWIEGKNAEIIRRWARGDPAALPELARELVEAKVDVIVTYGTNGALAARDATTTVPIVMAVSGDPVRAGLVASLARPGGNITGNSLVAPELSIKRLEILREIVPRARRIALLGNATNPLFAAIRLEEERAASRLGLEIVTAEIATPKDIEGLFQRLAPLRPDALLMSADPVVFSARTRIIRLATRRRLPTAGEGREFVEAGALVSYAPSLTALARRAATTVDRILRGAQPADLPVQQPATFELVINRRTANALGITVPPGILLRADDIID